jgi:hypothetical protein
MEDFKLAILISNRCIVLKMEKIALTPYSVSVHQGFLYDVRTFSFD